MVISAMFILERLPLYVNAALYSWVNRRGSTGIVTVATRTAGVCIDSLAKRTLSPKYSLLHFYYPILYIFYPLSSILSLYLYSV